MSNETQIVCECGCGTVIPTARFASQQARFVHGHNRRGHRHSALTIAQMSATKNGKTHLGGDRHPAWKGGRKRHSGGYVWVWIPGDHPFAEMRTAGGYVLEHRLVAADSLGRALARSEVVHHKNRDRQDNRAENLVVFTSNAEHSAFHAAEARP